MRAPVSLVTGARRGIGRGIAWALADSGFDVVVNDVDDDAAAAETVAGIKARGRRAVFLGHDIASIDGHAAFVERAYAETGALDCLVNNAGVQVGCAAMFSPSRRRASTDYTR